MVEWPGCDEKTIAAGIPAPFAWQPSREACIKTRNLQKRPCKASVGVSRVS